MRRQWDQAEHVLFNKTLFYQTITRAVYPEIPSWLKIVSRVGGCLVDAETRAGYLQAYQSSIGQNPVTYWHYVTVEVPPGRLGRRS
jgi:hypothetical protein